MRVICRICAISAVFAWLLLDLARYSITLSEMVVLTLSCLPNITSHNEMRIL